MSEQEEDFATMFEASVKARRFDRGQTVEGTIVGFGPKVAFVDVGGKAEAEIDLAELKDADGDVEVSVGDRIQAIVVSTSGGIVLSRKGVRNAATQRELEDAFRAGLAVEGKVEKARQGRLRGAHRPRTRVLPVLADRHRPHRGPGGARAAGLHVPHHRVQGRREELVVSRRKHLEEQQRASADDVRKSIVPGAVLTGRVVSVPDFGAFVDLGGGIQGLLHVSEMGWSRVTSPGEIVAPGDQITVKVLRVDEATQKISLGLKQLLDDPWTTAARRTKSARCGRAASRAWRNSAPSWSWSPASRALAHASTFAPTGRTGGWAKSVPVGSTGAFEILSIDTAQKRIGLALVDEGSSRAAGARARLKGAIVPGAIVTGKVERHEKFGVFVFLAPGRTGLMPFAETGLDRDADVLKAFPVGSEVEVVVLEVDPAGRRIRLSKKAVAEQREQAELRDYAARSDAASTVSLGSMADNLRNALKGR